MDAALNQQIMKNLFNDEELSEMTRVQLKRWLIRRLGAQHTAPIVSFFQQRFKDTYSNSLLKEGEQLHCGPSITTCLM